MTLTTEQLEQALNDPIIWAGSQHAKIIKAALEECLAARQVDVESLKRGKEHHHDGFYLSNNARGWF